MLKVTVDKQDFVMSAERVDSAMREIKKSETMPEPTQICKGPYHRRDGQGTLLPLSEFRVNKYSKTGALTKTCSYCLDNKNGPLRTIKAPPVQAVVQESKIIQTPEPPLMGSGFHKWSVTIIKPTTIIVYAKDFLDAGAEAGEGEIIDLKRLD